MNQFFPLTMQGLRLTFFIANRQASSIDFNASNFENKLSIIATILFCLAIATTVNIIHRALIGKLGEVAIVPAKDQRNAIINSVSNLMGTVVDFSGINDSLKKMKYTDKEGNELSFKLENLLSAGVLDAKVK